MEFKAFAKINLALKITGLLPGVYHSLDMINLPINLFDVVDIAIFGNDSLTEILCPSMPELKPESNLCYKATELLRLKFGFKENVRIKIEKNIPSQAGLGGGSSDAASVIAGLNQMLHLNMSLSEMDEIALCIGSDTPYFFRNKSCRLSGLGEKITEIENNCDLYCLLLKPQEGLSTKEVYIQSDRFDRQDIDVFAVMSGLKESCLSKISSSRGNDLEPAAISMLPILGVLLEQLNGFNDCISGMSGSGSTVFVLSPDADKLDSIRRTYINQFWCNISKVL